MKPIDPSLLAIFESEQREHLQRIRTLLERPEAGAALEEVFRRAHTLKGAARAVGLGSIELLAHRAEAAFSRVREGALALDTSLVAAVRRVLDAAEDVLACVLEHRAEPDVSEALRAIEGVLEITAPPVRKTTDLPAAAAPAPTLDTVRVSAAKIDDLVRSSSELLTAHARQVRAAQQSAALRGRIHGVQREWSRLRQRSAAAVRRLEADPELQAVVESLDFADNQLRALASQARTSDLEQQRGAWALQQLGAQLHQDACRVRMTPAEAVFGAFRKMVRDLAQDEGKQVDFREKGLEVEADRLVLQGLKDAVLHLLRNAISHGIEPPGERMAAGKPPAGAVQLRLEARGDRLNVVVEDDGRGIDLARVAEVAIRRGLISEAAAASQSPQDLARFILQPGFSTAPVVTRLAGRGMGLTIAQDQATRLHGELSFPERSAPGTSVLLSAPLSISTHHLLLARCGGQVFAIPTRAIERLCRVETSRLESFEGREAIRVGAAPVVLVKLAELLELPGGDGPGTGPTLVVVLRSGEQRAGMIVDALLDERQAVVKDLGLAAAIAGMSTGGVALEDGTVAVVLSPAALLERFRQAGRSPGLRPSPAEAQKKPARILVVDDSITTRSLEKSILEAHGYQVGLAVDGLEALERLRVEPADLVIADLAMPRLDGFQLLEQMKKDKQLARIPVIIVTSLERREDQERGLALGADAYIVKRKFDQRELLDTVRQIL